MEFGYRRMHTTMPSKLRSSLLPRLLLLSLLLLLFYYFILLRRPITSNLVSPPPWQPRTFAEANQDGVKGKYRVDVDIPADEWINVTSFYDVFIFNSGHWWGYDKFPKETSLVFYQKGTPINPPLDILQGFEVVLQHMVSFIQRQVPAKTLKFWRLQSPRHFYGGDWNQNGSCLLDKPLDRNQLDLWFDPRNNGVNKEARRINQIIKDELQTTEIKLLDLTHLSEYRADAHPAIWLGKQDAVAIWGQDCMHWCLPGVPDTWVDIVRVKNRDLLQHGSSKPLVLTVNDSYLDEIL